VSRSDDGILRFDDSGPDHGLVGDPALIAAVEAHIAEHYGPESSTWKHPVSEAEGSPIFLRLVRPRDGRPALTAVTVGMSEKPMVAGDREVSAELVIVLPPDWSFEPEVNTWPLLALDQLAHFPHQYGTAFEWGHTVQNPYPWSPNGMNGVLIADQMLLTSTEAESLEYDGRKIVFFGVYFLHPDEMQVKLDKGVDRLWDLCVDSGICEAVDETRPSFVPPKRRRLGFLRGR